MLKLLTSFFKSNPKEIVLNCREDLQKHAGALSTLSIEEREILTDYLLQAEVDRRLNNVKESGYGVSVGRAIEIQKNRNN